MNYYYPGKDFFFEKILYISFKIGLYNVKTKSFYSFQ